MAEPNPNGANGTTSDPREQIMWDIYVKNLDSGVDNAKQAALDAGYTESSANKITVCSWFAERKDKLRRKGLLSKAEKVLEKTLNYDTETIAFDKGGNLITNDEGRPHLITNTSLLKIQADVAKTVATTLGSKEGYVSKTELEVTTLTEEEKVELRGLLNAN